LKLTGIRPEVEEQPESPTTSCTSPAERHVGITEGVEYGVRCPERCVSVATFRRISHLGDSVIFRHFFLNLKMPAVFVRNNL
jgi:hypothetical protein